MKNILFLIDTTGPGGAETLFIELSKFFIDGNNVLSIVHGPGWVEKQLIDNKINYLRLENNGSYSIKFIIKLIKLIKDNEIDLIHAHLFRSSIYASLVGLITNTPVISTFHGLVDINKSDFFLKQKMYLLKKSSTIVAVSKKIKEYLIKESSLDDRDIRIISNGIYLNSHTSTNKHLFRKEHNIPDGHKIIGCLGNIRPAKDYRTAIESIKLTIKQNKNITLLIAGDTKSDLYNDYLKLINSYSLSKNIKFIGFINDPISFLSNIDIFFMTSTTEGQPISLFQAMSQKLPIVATKCGIEDILINGENAWLSPIKSPDSLAKHLLLALDDPNESSRRGENAYKYVNANYNIESMFDNYSNLYDLLACTD